MLCDKSTFRDACQGPPFVLMPSFIITEIISRNIFLLLILARVGIGFSGFSVTPLFPNIYVCYVFIKREKWFLSDLSKILEYYSLVFYFIFHGCSRISNNLTSQTAFTASAQHKLFWLKLNLPDAMSFILVKLTFSGSC